MGGRLSRLRCCFKGISQDNLNFTDLTSPGDEQPKTYSWDIREKPVACIVENEENRQVIRQTKGQQLIIRNCKSCRIYIFDWTTSATIDDCTDCVIFVSAVGGSLFLRDTVNTTLLSATTQLRLRDCTDIHLFSACESDPIIESCQNVQVAPYFLSYDNIEEHFAMAKLDNFKATHWGQIYDFTPPADPSQTNWSKLKEPYDLSRFLPPPTKNSANNIITSVNVNTNDTTVPNNVSDNNENSEQMNNGDEQERMMMSQCNGFHVGSLSFVPISKDSFNNNSDTRDTNHHHYRIVSKPTLILLPDNPTNRVEALQFLQKCDLSCSLTPSSASSPAPFSLLLSTVTSSLEAGQGCKVIALLFSNEPQNVFKLQIGTNNIRMTTDSQTISQYFNSNSH